MTYNEYTESRKNLITEANGLINEGKLDEANAKMEEVKALDEEWDKTAEAMATAKALEGNQRAFNVQDLNDSVAAAAASGGEATAKMSFVQETAGSLENDQHSTDAYKMAWAKTMMGKTLTAKETEIMEKANAYTHTTENTGVVIPKTVADGIWDMVEELYPYWNDIQKTYVKGNYNVPIGDESTAAEWYEEADVTADGKDTLKELALNGCELSRCVTISWKLKEMAIDDFINYIQRKLARKIGAGLGYGVTHGKGKPSASDQFKPEPLGVVTALEKEDKTPQIVKERIEGGANEKAVLRLFINCPFVCINFDFFWLNKARQLYMDF